MATYNGWDEVITALNSGENPLFQEIILEENKGLFGGLFKKKNIQQTQQKVTYGIVINRERCSFGEFSPTEDIQDHLKEKMRLGDRYVRLMGNPTLKNDNCMVAIFTGAQIEKISGSKLGMMGNYAAPGTIIMTAYPEVNDGKEIVYSNVTENGDFDYDVEDFVPKDVKNKLIDFYTKERQDDNVFDHVRIEKQTDDMIIDFITNNIN